MTRRGSAIDNLAYRRIAATGFRRVCRHCRPVRHSHAHFTTIRELTQDLAGHSPCELARPSRVSFHHAGQISNSNANSSASGPCPCHGCQSITPYCGHPRHGWLGENLSRAFVTLATVRLPFASDSLRRGRSRPRLRAASSGSCRASARSASEPPSAPGTTVPCAFSCIGRGRS